MTDPRPEKSLLRRVVGGAFALVVALWIFLEEWLWDLMQALMAWVGRLPPVRWCEALIARLPPRWALIAFLIPAAVLLPFKIAALWLIAHGHGVYGLWVFVVAKVIGTAILARIFALTKDALMTIGWFARGYRALVGWKERLYAYVRALPVYRRVRALAQAMREQLKAWWRAVSGG